MCTKTPSSPSVASRSAFNDCRPGASKRSPSPCQICGRKSMNCQHRGSFLTSLKAGTHDNRDRRSGRSQEKLGGRRECRKREGSGKGGEEDGRRRRREAQPHDLLNDRTTTSVPGETLERRLRERGRTERARPTVLAPPEANRCDATLHVLLFHPPQCPSYRCAGLVARESLITRRRPTRSRRTTQGPGSIARPSRGVYVL